MNIRIYLEVFENIQKIATKKCIFQSHTVTKMSEWGKKMRFLCSNLIIRRLCPEIYSFFQFKSIVILKKYFTRALKLTFLISLVEWPQIKPSQNTFQLNACFRVTLKIANLQISQVSGKFGPPLVTIDHLYHCRDSPFG